LETALLLTALIETVTTAMVSFIGAVGYVGIFVLMALESACIPLPSEITMPFSGFLASQGNLDFWLVVLAGGLGNLVGSLAAYWVGVGLEDHVLRAGIRKHGKWVLMSERDYDLAERWFREHGELVVFVSRLLPIVRTFISLPAGVAQMNVLRFSVYTLTGSLLWSALLTYIGLKLGENWHTISTYWHELDFAVAAALLACLGFYIWHKRDVLARWRTPS
jgi:membrane protein DedA with SNARE-associated domain